MFMIPAFWLAFQTRFQLGANFGTFPSASQNPAGACSSLWLVPRGQISQSIEIEGARDVDSGNTLEEEDIALMLVWRTSLNPDWIGYDRAQSFLVQRVKRAQDRRLSPHPTNAERLFEQAGAGGATDAEQGQFQPIQTNPARPSQPRGADACGWRLSAIASGRAPCGNPARAGDGKRQIPPRRCFRFKRLRHFGGWFHSSERFARNFTFQSPCSPKGAAGI